MSEDQGVVDEAVGRLARALYEADFRHRSVSASGSPVPQTFDFDWAWNECATMPLSGPGFVAGWMTLARAAIAAFTPPAPVVTTEMERQRADRNWNECDRLRGILTENGIPFEQPIADPPAPVEQRGERTCTETGRYVSDAPVEMGSTYEAAEWLDQNGFEQAASALTRQLRGLAHSAPKDAGVEDDGGEHITEAARRMVAIQGMDWAELDVGDIGYWESLAAEALSVAPSAPVAG